MKKIHWSTVPLRSLGEFRNGVNFDKSKKNNGEIGLINVKDIFTDIPCIDFESLDKVDLAREKGIEKFYVQAGDLFFVRSSVKRDGVGLVSMSDRNNSEAIHCGFVIRYRPDLSKVCSRFLVFLLRSPMYRQKIIGISGGATIINVSQDTLGNLEISLPPLPTQRFIADILSTYNNLIENNTRRIQILEEMAQAIYREWFVHFRFPGHEGMRLVESPLGLIPEGWEAATIRDVTSYVNRGVSPKYDDKSDSWVINQKCIRGNQLSLDPARKHATKVPPEKVIRFGDILINSTGVGTLGRVAQVYQELPNHTVDSHVTIVRPNNLVSIDYFGFCLSSLQNYFDRMGMGATNQTELGRETVAKTDFLLPPLSIQNKFSELVSPIRKSMIVHQQRNDNLRQQRDLLLPRLVSGEVDVVKIIPEIPEAI